MSYKRIEVYLIYLFFITLGLWRYSDVIFSPDFALANSGDGIATIAGVFALSEQVLEYDSSLFISDVFHFERHGGLLAQPGPFSQFWKIIDVIFGGLFEPNTAYDIVGMLGFVLACVCGFHLFRYIRLNGLVSAMLAVILASLDVTLIRANSHLFGIGVFFIPILVVLYSVKAGEEASRKNIILLAVLHAFNFNINEYYGYFGVFFSASYILTSWGMKVQDVDMKGLVKSILFGLCVFLVIMLLLYPTVIRDPLIAKLLSFGGDEAVGGVEGTHHVHDWNSFLIFSISNIYSIFEPDNAILTRFVNMGVFKNELWEMTYRVGLAIPLFIVGIVYTVMLKDKSKILKDIRAIIPLGIASTIMLCLSLNPSYSLSLVPLTYKVAPMFRVSTRALLYFDIGIILMLAFSLKWVISVIMERVSNRWFSQVLASAIVCFVCLLSYSDSSKISIVGKLPALPLPVVDVYKPLDELPDGVLIELPYQSPKTATPESVYEYLYNRIAHKKPIANQVYTGSNNTKYLESIHQFANNVNNMDEKFLKELFEGGLRYIAVKKEMRDVVSIVESSDEFELVSMDDKTRVYIASDINSLPKITIQEFVYSNIVGTEE